MSYSDRGQAWLTGSARDVLDWIAYHEAIDGSLAQVRSGRYGIEFAHMNAVDAVDRSTAASRGRAILGVGDPGVRGS